MKKIIIAFSVLVFALNVSAQKHSHLGFGFKAGTNFSKYLGADVSSSNTILKPYFGGSANYKFNKKVCIKQEILFSSEGSQLGQDPNKEKVTTNYLSFPLMLQLNISKSFFLETGPQLNVLLNAKDILGNVTTDIKANYQPATLGWDLGIGLNLKSGFGMNARYVPTLGNILKDQPYKFHSSVIAIGFFYNLWSKE
jgi:hypothetical protein